MSQMALKVYNMNNHTLKNPADDEDHAIASRRKFLKQLACGSLLTISGSGIASAAVRHVYHKSSARHSAHSHHSHSHHHSHSSHPAHGHHSHSHHSVQVRHSTHVHQPAEVYRTAQTYNAIYKDLSLHNTNTGDKLSLTYFEQGRYIKEALEEISYLFRDYHTDEVHPVDTALLDQLYDLKRNLDVNKPFHVISGYRSPYTNAHLRQQSHRVAKHSLHMEGRAIDIRIEGLDTRMIRNAALAMRQGGVGYYPRANFVHLDTGEIRTW